MSVRTRVNVRLGARRTGRGENLSPEGRDSRAARLAGLPAAKCGQILVLLDLAARHGIEVEPARSLVLGAMDGSFERSLVLSALLEVAAAMRGERVLSGLELVAVAREMWRVDRGM